VKLPIYARNGIVEVWIIDLNNDAIHIYRDPTDDGYRFTQISSRGESVSPHAFPAFSIKVDDLLG